MIEGSQPTNPGAGTGSSASCPTEDVAVPVEPTGDDSEKDASSKKDKSKKDASKKKSKKDKAKPKKSKKAKQPKKVEQLKVLLVIVPGSAVAGL
jgi:hypothetical protein